jgi:CrcB protein
VIGGLISVVVGSALGGVSRYFLSGVVARRVGETFPWGTLVVNVTGAFVIGVFGGLATDNAALLGSPDLWLLAVTGFCGGYTTVSSFSLQTLALARDGERLRAAAYVALSVVLCLLAVAGGIASVGALK